MKYILIPILFLLLSGTQNTIQAQELTVTNTNIILELDGSITPSHISFIFDPLIFPLHTYTITTLSNPMGPACAPQYNNDVIFDQSFTINVGNLFGESCEGEYCYRIVKDLNTPDECEIVFCVFVNYCFYVPWGHGKKILVCYDMAPPPNSDSFSTNDDNSNELSTNQEPKINAITNEKHQPTSNNE